ncbi:hypothetical protein M8494_11085 [Serratia ureilytica]
MPGMHARADPGGEKLWQGDHAHRGILVVPGDHLSLFAAETAAASPIGRRAIPTATNLRCKTAATFRLRRCIKGKRRSCGW